MLADPALLRVVDLEMVYFSQDSMGISNTHARVCYILLIDLPERKIGNVQKW